MKTNTWLNNQPYMYHLNPARILVKQPPCADLVIRRHIPEVVIGCRDSYAQVDGKGIQKLAAAGTKIIYPVLENEALELNRRFFTFHSRQRPYILLKWAQTADGKIGNSDNSRLFISNELTNREVHRWRSTESSILVGTRTALKDDPSLTNRLWTGSQPLRLVVDKELKLPPSLHLFDGSTRTIVFNLC
jgi:diaminohydroxyphosphoribosylaminopyrimidine deaminase/5-amino-6-(5-phosphoribosylamino)uracil reductase